MILTAGTADLTIIDPWSLLRIPFMQPPHKAFIAMSSGSGEGAGPLSLFSGSSSASRIAIAAGLGTIAVGSLLLATSRGGSTSRRDPTGQQARKGGKGKQRDLSDEDVDKTRQEARYEPSAHVIAKTNSSNGNTRQMVTAIFWDTDVSSGPCPACPPCTGCSPEIWAHKHSPPTELLSPGRLVRTRSGTSDPQGGPGDHPGR